MTRGLLVSFFMIIAAGVGSSLAHAADMCVACVEPAKTYVCRGKAAPEHQIFLQDNRLLQLACIKKIAKNYGHSKCKTNRVAPQACIGPLVTVDVSHMARQYTERMPKPLQPTTGRAYNTPRPSDRSASPTDEPKTVVELAKRTAQNSQKQLNNVGEAVKKAGQAVGDGAEKTLRCLGSFFQDC